MRCDPQSCAAGIVKNRLTANRIHPTAFVVHDVVSLAFADVADCPRNAPVTFSYV
jgi:hypothetical protein